MKFSTLHYKTLLAVVALAFLALPTFAVNRSWTGAIDNDFNNVGNWTGGGALSAVDNFTVLVGASTTVTLSGDITINNLTFTANSSAGAGIVLARLDVQSHTLTINGTAAFNPVRYTSNTERDEVQVDAGTGAFIFHGAATFQTTGGGDTFIEADAANQGSMTFMSLLTLGDWAYTSPGVEPDFIYDATGAQSIVYNSNNFVVPASMIFGSTNSPTVTYSGAGTEWAFSVYDGDFTLNNSSIAILNDFDSDAYLGADMTLNDGTEMRLGDDSDFPTAYTTVTVGSQSTVVYNGSVAQTVTARQYGNLEIAGSNTKTSAGSFSIEGDFTNNGTFAHGNDMHTFDGTAAQNINGANSTTFYRLTCDKASGDLLLGINTIVSNRITLTNGALDLNGFDLRLTRNVISALVRTNGYMCSERSDMTSTFTRRVAAVSGGHVFPFALTDGTYIPFTYDRNTGNAGYVTVATYPTAADNTPFAPTVTHVAGVSVADNSPSTVDRFWQIDVTGAVSADITFTYADAEVPSLGETDLRAQRWDGTGWDQSNVSITSQSANAGTNTVTAAGVSAASPWTLARNASPLPIDLLSFSANCQGSSVDINWSTATETNNSHFTIEKSLDNINFEPFAEVAGAGNSSSTIDYSYTDNSPYNGITYYRLKQTDFNGESETFEVVAAGCENDDAFDVITVYSNGDDIVNATIQVESESDYTFTLQDLSGRIIVQEQRFMDEGYNAVELQAKSLAPGIYILNCGNEINSISKKVFLK